MGNNNTDLCVELWSSSCSVAVQIKCSQWINIERNKMNKLLLLTVLLPTIELIVARPQQQQIDPAYLRDYYAQLSQQNGVRGSVSDVTPIFEQNTSFQPSAQVATVGSQIRVRDSVQDQVNSNRDIAKFRADHDVSHRKAIVNRKFIAQIRVQQPQYTVPTVRQYNQQQPQVSRSEQKRILNHNCNSTVSCLFRSSINHNINSKTSNTIDHKRRQSKR